MTFSEEQQRLKQEFADLKAEEKENTRKAINWLGEILNLDISLLEKLPNARDRFFITDDMYLHLYGLYFKNQIKCKQVITIEGTPQISYEGFLFSTPFDTVEIGLFSKEEK